MTAADILADADTNMELAVEYAKEEFAAIRTGRAHPAMFAKINAEYYGAYTPLQQLASFQVPEARMVLVTPYDRGSLPAIEKAIRESDLGVNPSNDGNSIRLVLPELTEQRRKEYIKLARGKAEDARISIRGSRRHGQGRPGQDGQGQGGRRGRGDPRREAAGRLDQEVRRPGRRRPQAQGSRAARRLSSPLLARDVPIRPPARLPTRPGRSRAEPRPVATCPRRSAIGVGLGAYVVLSLLFFKPAFVLLVAVALVLGSRELHAALKRQGMNAAIVPIMVGDRRHRHRLLPRRASSGRSSSRPPACCSAPSR